MIRVLTSQIAAGLFSALFTDRFVLNSVVVLLEWLSRRTTNDLDDKLVEQLKQALDKNCGSEVNLYDELRKR